MSEQGNALLLHIGPLRSESQRIIHQFGTPVWLVVPPNTGHQAEGKSTSARYTKAWVTAKGGDHTCYHYSLDDFNSLAEGIGLTELYPGVVLQQSQPVETHAISELLNNEGIVSDDITALIIEQADQTLPLLNELKAQGLLATLTHLWLRTSTVRLYAGMPLQKSLIEWCEEQGFEPIEAHADDPEFTLQGFKRNRLHDPLKITQQQVDEHKQKLEVVSKERDELSKTQEVAKKESEALRNEILLLKQQNQQLVNEANETQQKQRLLEIELERAEAQLELIKELMLKDKLLNGLSNKIE